jgi:hypothetical protein
MDLIMTISNTTAHMAGALGKPVWLLLPKVPNINWWMLDREDSPWYPSMRVFRQSSPSGWNTLYQQAAQALAGMLVGSFAG